MRRFAMAKPLVARRSPASTTPSAKRIATTVVPCGMSTEACCAPGACTGPASGGAVRRSRSANDGPGSNPGPKRGSGRSFIGERAYSGEFSANAPQKAPEPQLATQSAHPPCVVHAFDHFGGRQVLHFHGSYGIRRRALRSPEDPPRHAQKPTPPSPAARGLAHVELCSTDPVPTLQVIMPSATVEPLTRFTTACVMT